MRKRLTVLLAALLAVITGVFFAGCDIGLNDIAENENNPLESMFKEFLQDLDWKEYLTEDEIREILNSVDPKDFLTKEKMEKLLEDVDLTQFLSNEDMEKLLEGVDLKQFISDEEMEELLEGVDLKQFISDEDMEELLRGIDLKEFLSDEDIEALLRRVDLKQFLTEEDIKELLGDTDYRYFLNAKTSVEYLITDLTRLRDVAQDPVYAAVQARTVMTSYGLADLALSDENFSGAQALRMQSLRADLYEYIAVLTILTSPVSGEYDAQEVISRANRTIGICNAILRELTQSY